MGGWKMERDRRKGNEASAGNAGGYSVETMEEGGKCGGVTVPAFFSARRRIIQLYPHRNFRFHFLFISDSFSIHFRFLLWC